MSESRVYIIVACVYVVALAPDLIKLFRLIKNEGNISVKRIHLFRLNLILFILAFTLSSLLVCLEVNLFRYSAPVEYSKLEEISLKDFKGYKLPYQTHQGMNTFAFITTSIDFKLINKNTYEVKSYFHPARSYVYINDLQNNELLRHEIYHFHITELWTRHLRKMIRQQIKNSNTKSVGQLYKKVKLMEVKMQQQYDLETDHGYLLGKQLFWQQKVDSMLLEFDDFSKPFVHFN